jgi:uncharacterized protein
MLAELVGELRGIGIPVSVGEHLDAASAVSQIPLRAPQDKELLRAALQATLIKNAEHLTAFNLIFDLYTAGTPGGLAELSDAELRDTLRQEISAPDSLLLARLADEYVRRFAGVEPGLRVAGVMYTRNTLAAADLEGLRGELGGGGGGGSGGLGAGLSARLAQAEADQATERFRDEIQAAVRRTLVADRGAAAVRATMRVGLAADADIGTASAAELEAMASAIGPLVQQLTRVLHSRRRRQLSLRGTLRAAMASGGVPFRLVTQPARPPKPDLVVLCDVSGSVATFSRFTLDLLIALDSRLSRLRVFSFIDGLAEITGLVADARAAGRRLDPALVARESVRFSGSSDYGWVLREFAARHARQLTQRTVVLILGDARTNYVDPAVAALAEIQRRAGRVYWLNPEPRRAWNDGDSVIGQYAPYCAQVRECRTLRQIADFVQSLA